MIFCLPARPKVRRRRPARSAARNRCRYRRDWTAEPPREATDHYLDNVLGLRSDEDGVVWIIDMGFRTGIAPKLVGLNTRTDSLKRIYYMLKPVTRDGSQPQDIVIARKHGRFYIADEKSHRR